MAKAALTQEQWAEVRRLRDELDLTTETIAARMACTLGPSSGAR